MHVAMLSLSATCCLFFCFGFFGGCGGAGGDMLGSAAGQSFVCL